jgi:hypothetical protein
MGCHRHRSSADSMTTVGKTYYLLSTKPIGHQVSTYCIAQHRYRHQVSTCYIAQHHYRHQVSIIYSAQHHYRHQVSSCSNLRAFVGTNLQLDLVVDYSQCEGSPKSLMTVLQYHCRIRLWVLQSTRDLWSKSMAPLQPTCIFTLLSPIFT